MTPESAPVHRIRLLVAALAMALPAACGVNDNPVLEGPPPTTSPSAPATSTPSP
ncbi:MAG: hypothetical protein WD178_04965 [Actinomycetota bacterium]